MTETQRTGIPAHIVADNQRVIANLMKPVPRVMEAIQNRATDEHMAVLESEVRTYGGLANQALHDNIETATLLIETGDTAGGAMYLHREACTMELRHRLGHDVPGPHGAVTRGF